MGRFPGSGTWYVLSSPVLTARGMGLTASGGGSARCRAIPPLSGAMVELTAVRETVGMPAG